VVELEGIEPSSAKRLPPVIRPFPDYGSTAAVPPGRVSLRPPPDLSPMSTVFLVVSGLSLPSSTASVAGLQWTGPACHCWSLWLSDYL